MIITINPDNELKFKEIESAILAIVLDDSEPETEDVLIKNVFKGGNGCSDIYAEKSWSRVATKNGLFASQSEVCTKSKFSTSSKFILNNIN